MFAEVSGEFVIDVVVGGDGEAVMAKAVADVTTTLALWLGDGESIEVGDDRDGLECLEIRFRAADGKVADAILVPAQHVDTLRRLLAIWQDNTARIANEAAHADAFK